MLFTPRIIQPARRAIIYAHGANGTGTQLSDWTNQPSLTRFFQQIAAAGYVVLSSDWGGLQTYGNDTELAAMEAGWTYLKNSGLCATDKVILTGASMGTLSTHRFAKEHPTWVAGINCWIPFVDVEYGRNSNVLGLRDLINSAWGLAAGSYQNLDASTVPYNGKPLSYASSMSAIPTHMWYSTGDSVSNNMQTYLDSRNSVASGIATGHITSTVATHSDAAISPADIDSIITFFNSVSS